MRVVQVSPFYYPVVGGVEKVVREISEYAVKIGHEAMVITYNRTRDGKRLSEEEERNGVRIFRVNPNFSWGHGTFSTSLPKQVRRMRGDVIHVHVWRHPHVFQLSGEKGVRILQPHSPFYKLDQTGLINYAYYKMADNLLGKFMRTYNVIAITPQEKDILSKKFKINSTVIPNGVEDNLFSDDRYRGDYYLMIGRISREKNVMALIEAYKLCKPDRPAIIVGPDGGLGDQLNMKIRESRVNVQYIGEVSYERKVDLIKKSMALVSTSPFEGFGLSIAEASAMGKPAILVKGGGQEYASPPGVGSIAINNDPESLCKAMKELDDDYTWSKLSIGARKWAENFRLSTTLPKYFNLYELLAGNLT
ncbi:glycosyl transferase family 1 [Sulfolobales archaeon HS-7]|nr:glycosyl transferase family 1 [Sulfolobales archaeon HS-7]